MLPLRLRRARGGCGAWCVPMSVPKVQGRQRTRETVGAHVQGLSGVESLSIDRKPVVTWCALSSSQPMCGLSSVSGGPRNEAGGPGDARGTLGGRGGPGSEGFQIVLPKL